MNAATGYRADSDLVNAMIRQDHRAWEFFSKRHYRVIVRAVRIALGKAGNAERADGLAHGVQVLLFLNPHILAAFCPGKGTLARVLLPKMIATFST